MAHLVDMTLMTLVTLVVRPTPISSYPFPCLSLELYFIAPAAPISSDQFFNTVSNFPTVVVAFVVLVACVAHMPLVVLYIQMLKPLDWHPWVKFTVVCSLITVSLLVTYQLFVRHTLIGEILNGKRKPKVKSES